MLGSLCSSFDSNISIGCDIISRPDDQALLLELIVVPLVLTDIIKLLFTCLTDDTPTFSVKCVTKVSSNRLAILEFFIILSWNEMRE